MNIDAFNAHYGADKLNQDILGAGAPSIFLETATGTVSPLAQAATEALAPEAFRSYVAGNKLAKDQYGELISSRLEENNRIAAGLKPVGLNVTFQTPASQDYVDYSTLPAIASMQADNVSPLTFGAADTFLTTALANTEFSSSRGNITDRLKSIGQKVMLAAGLEGFADWANHYDPNFNIYKWIDENNAVDKADLFWEGMTQIDAQKKLDNARQNDEILAMMAAERPLAAWLGDMTGSSAQLSLVLAPVLSASVLSSAALTGAKIGTATLAELELANYLNPGESQQNILTTAAINGIIGAGLGAWAKGAMDKEATNKIVALRDKMLNETSNGVAEVNVSKVCFKV